MSYDPITDFYLQVAKGDIEDHSTVNKFGFNGAVPNGTFEIVSTLSQAYNGSLAAPTAIRIKAGGNPADTALGLGARSIFVEGIDDSLARVVVEIPTAGASASAATTELFWRVDRSYVGGVGSYAAPVNTGNIIVETGGGASDLIEILAGSGQSQHCFVAVPGGVDAYLLGYELSADSVQRADFRLMTRAEINNTTVPVSPLRIKRSWGGIIGTVEHQFRAPPLMLAGPGEIFIEAAGGGAVTSVSASFDLVLVTP